MEDESLKIKNDFDTTMLSIKKVDQSAQIRLSFVQFIILCFLFLLFTSFMGVQIYLYVNHQSNQVRENTIIHTQIVETIS